MWLAWAGSSFLHASCISPVQNPVYIAKWKRCAMLHSLPNTSIVFEQIETLKTHTITKQALYRFFPFQLLSCVQKKAVTKLIAQQQQASIAADGVPERQEP